MRLYRQGDILLVETAEPPKFTSATRIKRKRGQGIIVAAGEATGHHHRVRTKGATEHKTGGKRFLKVSKAGAELTHEEHDTILLVGGTYEIRNQTEYEQSPPTPKASARPAQVRTRVWD